MRPTRLLGLAFFLAVATFGLTAAQDKKPVDKKDDPPVKAKGQLLANWKALGLTADQVQMVYKTQTKYTAQIDELKAKIDKLKSEEKAELLKVLTEEQKKKLAEIKTGEKPPEKPAEKDKPKDK